jgi:hypothetical protein
MPSGAESATLLEDGLVVEPVDRYLAHLTAIERSPNTVKAYAHDLRDYFVFLRSRSVEWADVSLEDLGRFVEWLRLAGEARGGRVALLPWAEGDLGRDNEQEAVGAGVVLRVPSAARGGRGRPAHALAAGWQRWLVEVLPGASRTVPRSPADGGAARRTAGATGPCTRRDDDSH